MPPAHGAQVLSRMRKWDGTQHWTAELRYLGADAFGHWLGAGPGGRVRRPGFEFETRNFHVRWVPVDAWFVAGFNGKPALRLYLDLTTPAELVETGTGWELRAVDLDLDIVVGRDDPWSAAQLVDEDEFAEHQVLYAYPADVVRAVEQTAQDLLARIRCSEEPYLSVAGTWHARLHELLAADPTPR
ncbi:hypothetical protein FB554_1399 [Barrientosiimonas humi]|uniref:DUF402 domain-containing protein n=1 Tax=Barrientosiimonas humi TaxID=999931 RepID=A0A542XBN9_9MICO|nr:DUF402 domain-containing protein [Barrientosiimonas humi]TQL33257.1 hypothetical protein FB554_1399 [Barrientosiimonas humi]CAG7573246.1 hypothetical protein BH39T_PBIAJDOK_01877 [Barrientosiimonas humi]